MSISKDKPMIRLQIRSISVAMQADPVRPIGMSAISPTHKRLTLVGSGRSGNKFSL